MKDQVLSIEQMQKLKGLGVDTSNASMSYQKNIGNNEYKQMLISNDDVRKLYDDSVYPSATPSFTLQDMIELMPIKVIKDNTEFYLIIDKSTIGYIDITEEYLVHKSYNGLLNNAFNMLVWLAENKYI